MGDVINIEDLREKTKYNDYGNGILSVVNDDAGIELVPDGDMFFISVWGETSAFSSRKDIAEFLWQCAHFVDSEGRWKKSEYVGIDYV